MKLNEVEVGSTVTVKKIEGDGAYKRRIMDMGITKGVELYIRKVAPLGDPVEITVRGYELSVRKNDAPTTKPRLFKNLLVSSLPPILLISPVSPMFNIVNGILLTSSRICPR